MADSGLGNLTPRNRGIFTQKNFSSFLYHGFTFQTLLHQANNGPKILNRIFQKSAPSKLILVCHSVLQRQESILWPMYPCFISYPPVNHLLDVLVVTSVTCSSIGADTVYSCRYPLGMLLSMLYCNFLFYTNIGPQEHIAKTFTRAVRDSEAQTTSRQQHIFLRSQEICPRLYIGFGLQNIICHCIQTNRTSVLNYILQKMSIQLIGFILEKKRGEMFW